MREKGRKREKEGERKEREGEREERERAVIIEMAKERSDSGGRRHTCREREKSVSSR